MNMLSFYVRANLHAALLHLREQNEAVHVWVDAICINQNDPDEKATQMSRIRYIYSQASSVYIWLGEGDSDNKKAFDFLRQILDPGGLDKLLAEPLLTARKWRLILDLMHNPWFSRRWTLQEIVFTEGPIVVWGDEILKWEDVSDALSLFVANFEHIKRTSLDPTDEAGGYPCDPHDMAASMIIQA